MKEMALCMFLTLTGIFIDWVKKTLKPWDVYFFWFCMLIVASFFFQNNAYGDEEKFYEVKLNNFEFEDYRFKLNDTQIVKEFKFVPVGVPPSHVNEDDSLSDKAKNLIRSTNRKTAYLNRERNRLQAEVYQEKWESLCWAIPDLSQQKIVSAAFQAALTSSFAPGMQLKMCAVFLSLVGSFGQLYIENWYDIRYTAKMCAWHALVEIEYCNHIQERGW